MPKEPKLKNCPFCGGKAELYQEQSNDKWFTVECFNEKCPVKPVADFKPQKRYAIEAWNRRDK